MNKRHIKEDLIPYNQLGGMEIEMDNGLIIKAEILSTEIIGEMLKINLSSCSISFSGLEYKIDPAELKKTRRSIFVSFGDNGPIFSSVANEKKCIDNMLIEPFFKVKGYTHRFYRK